MLEVSAEKPGNITPRHDFDDTSYGVVGGEAAGHELAARVEAELAGAGRVELVRFGNEGAKVQLT